MFCKLQPSSSDLILYCCILSSIAIFPDVLTDQIVVGTDTLSALFQFVILRSVK